MSEYGYIAVNDDHGWGKGPTSGDARRRSLMEGRKATHIRVWECANAAACVDGMGTVFGVVQGSEKNYRRRAANARAWKEVPHDPNDTSNTALPLSLSRRNVCERA